MIGEEYKRKLLREMHGPTGLLDAAPYRAHVGALVAAGWTPKSIAAVAGITPPSVRRLASGTTQQVSRASAAGLMRTTHTVMVREAPTLPPFLLARRITALWALGWTSQHIADGTTHTPKHVRALTRGGRYAWRSTADGIMARYDTLSGSVGPSTQGRRRAIAAGHAPPLAWDDIDDPQCTPHRGGMRDTDADEVAVWRALRGETVPLRYADRRAIADHALDAGWTSGVLAGRTGMSVVAATAALTRARKRAEAVTEP